MVDCCVVLCDSCLVKSLTANYSALRAKCMSKTPGDMFSSTTQSPSHHNSHTHCCVMSGCWQCCIESALLPTTTFVHVYVWVVAWGALCMFNNGGCCYQCGQAVAALVDWGVGESWWTLHAVLHTTPHHKSPEQEAEPQQIVAQRLLSCLQYPVPYLSRLQRI